MNFSPAGPRPTYSVYNRNGKSLSLFGNGLSILCLAVKLETTNASGIEITVLTNPLIMSLLLETLEIPNQELKSDKNHGNVQDLIFAKMYLLKV